VYDLASVLERWERETQVSFPDEVWREYTAPVSRTTTLYRCLGCGFAIFHPPVGGSTDFYSAVAKGQYYVEGKWDFHQGVRDLTALGAGYVLDIGCGSGYFLDLLKGKGIRGIGYEFNQESAAEGRFRGHEILNGPFPEAVAAGAPFDAICMFQVLEHLSNPIAFLRDLRGLLQPGGYLLVSVPDAAGPIRYFTDALTEIPPHHVSRWREMTFRIGMPGLGFTVQKALQEPLPDYLWHAYLPAMWETGIWPAEICRSIEGMATLKKSEAVLRFIDEMKKYGIKWLWGVPGHSLYMVLRREHVRQRAPGEDPCPTEGFPNECLKEEIRLGRYRNEVESRERYLLAWQEDINHRQVELTRKEEELSERVLKSEAALRRKEEELLERTAAVVNREEACAAREERYNALLLVRMARRMRASLGRG
jgi:SAM-dependent methyltransferase